MKDPQNSSARYLHAGRRALCSVALYAALLTGTLTFLPSSEAAAKQSPVPAPTEAFPSRLAKATTSKPVPRGVKQDTVLVGVLNLNSATADQLQLLPGVGPAKAERVVSDRSKRGKFRRVKDLRRVKGFGYKTLRKLGPYLAVTGLNTLRVEPTGKDSSRPVEAPAKQRRAGKQ